MQLTFYGHATYSITVNDKIILFDPFFTGNPGAKDVDIDKIKADFIFVTHGHGDHTADLVHVAKKTGALCVGSAEVVGWLKKNGVEKAHPLNHGGPVAFDFGGKARGVNAIHSSSFSDGSYAGNPLGFVFTTTEGDFYTAGDTALTLDMQLIPLWAPRLRFAVLPIGGNYTMDPADALHASNFIKCDTIVGVHYNTWPIVQIDAKQAKGDFAKAGKQLLLPAYGETIEV